MTLSEQIRALAAADRANDLPRHAERLDWIADGVRRLEDRVAMVESLPLHPACEMRVAGGMGGSVVG